MKIEFSIEAETAAELLKGLQNFVGSTGIGENAGAKGNKKGASDDAEEDKPAKKIVKKVVEEEAEDKAPTHEDARAAIVNLAKKLEWDPAPPKIQAFTKKFAKAHDLMEDDGETLIQRIPQIPVKKLKAFLQAIKDEGEI
jgi:hypothetical protein